MYYKRFLGIALAFVVITGCGREREPSLPSSEEIIQEDKFLFERLPLGADWEKASKVIPGLEPPGPEGGFESLGRQGLTEAKASVEIQDHQGTVECNFRNGLLYSCFWFVDGMNEQTASALADSVAGEYAERFGEGLHEIQDDPGTSIHSIYWQTDKIEVSVSWGGYSERWFVSWGFQEPSSF